MKYIFYLLLLLFAKNSLSQNNIVNILSSQDDLQIILNGELLSNNNNLIKNLPKGSCQFTFTSTELNKSSDLWIYLEKNDSVVINVDLSENRISPAYYKREYDHGYLIEKYRTVFFVVEEMPLFLGDDGTLENYISRSVKEKRDFLPKKMRGKVFVQFEITRKGELGTVRLVKGLGNELDALAIEIIKNMPKWEPGSQRGKPVRVSFTIPIKF